MKYKSINPTLFITNRKRLIAEVPNCSLIVFHSNDLMPRNGDTFFPFRQNSDLFYMSGIDQEESILVIYKTNSNDYQEKLFIKRTDAHIAVWEGKKLSQNEAETISGITSIYWIDEFEIILEQMVKKSDIVFLNLNENDRFKSDVPYRDYRFSERIKTLYPKMSFKSISPKMMQLRQIKHPIEIELIKQAVNITREAYLKVLQFVKPGVMEYEIEAEITRDFIRLRGNGHAYHPIIASGKDSCILHYVFNNKQCQSGDILLLDFGAEYANYASDLSRTIPVNGRFSERQKEVYQAVLDTLHFAKSILINGISIAEYHKEVCLFIEKQLIKIKLLSKVDIQTQDSSNPAYRKYYMHGTSHFMGLDVHDLGDKQMPIQPGMLFSCEPGIYIPDENLGIRLENDILITPDGNIDLMHDFPLTIEEIENAMNE